MPRNLPHKALLTANISLTDSGGKSLRVLSLAELLRVAGFEVTLIVSRCNSIGAKKFSVIETKTDLPEVLPNSLLKRVLHYLKESSTLLSFYTKLLVLGDNYKIIVSSLVGPEIDSLLASMLGRIGGVPFVYDYDDPTPEIRIVFFGRGANDLRVRLSLFTRNILIRSASLVLTSAETVRHSIVEDFRTKRVCVWYNIPKMDDVHVDKSKEQMRKKLGFAKNAFIVSYLGTVPSWFIERMKSVLLEFTKEFKNDENVLFLMIGGGRGEKYYRDFIKKQRLENRVLITGMIPRQNALEYFMASDLSCIPCDVGPAASNILPTKLFEAMALGIPILVPRSTNFAQILGDEGIYFDGSLRDLVRKIRWCLVNRKELKEISSNLESRFHRQYSWQQRALNLGDVLRSLTS